MQSDIRPLIITAALCLRLVTKVWKQAKSSQGGPVLVIDGSEAQNESLITIARSKHREWSLFFAQE